MLLLWLVSRLASTIFFAVPLASANHYCISCSSVDLSIPEWCWSDELVLANDTVCKEESFWKEQLTIKCERSAREHALMDRCADGKYKRMSFICCAPKKRSPESKAEIEFSKTPDVRKYKAFYSYYISTTLKEIYSNRSCKAEQTEPMPEFHEAREIERQKEKKEIISKSDILEAFKEAADEAMLRVTAAAALNTVLDMFDEKGRRKEAPSLSHLNEELKNKTPECERFSGIFEEVDRYLNNEFYRYLWDISKEDYAQIMKGHEDPTVGILKYYKTHLDDILADPIKAAERYILILSFALVCSILLLCFSAMKSSSLKKLIGICRGDKREGVAEEFCSDTVKGP
ncbi:hypothetical protein QR680_015085 [Steinernema hermaphroditum]|uniref:Uncharacterized protein n=1 Tax=Steinernema hermaphroditum TaxID=289476 RepID=A0AA39IDA6_9BILA|nr:hypothetical protein QR680_015085 [Steinernema hermaphroditum]